MNKNLEKYTKSIVNNESDNRIHFKQYLKLKILETIESIKEGVDMGPVKLSGDDVFVNDKLVGHLKNDLNDFEKGIEFFPLDGKPTQEFDNIRQLYRFLLLNYANGKVLK